MIVRETAGRFTLVRQADHDDQCGRMAAYLDPALFPSAESQRALTLAAFLHDNGWDAWEEQPRLQPDTRRPLNFTRIGEAERCALYREGIALAVEAHPLVGLLVSMHGLGLQRRFLGIHGQAGWRTPPPDEDPEVERFCQEQELLQVELIERLRTDAVLADLVVNSAAPDDDGGPHPLRYDLSLLRLYKLLELLDALSLRLAWLGLSENPPLEPVPDVAQDAPDQMLTVRKVAEHTLALAPYPFTRSPLDVPLPARLLDDRAYADDADYRAAFAAAAVVLLPFRLVAG
ncbi:MAG: hypothetical protein PVSMB4_15330 [Ktedonobacterales bacterium]